MPRITSGEWYLEQADYRLTIRSNTYSNAFFIAEVPVGPSSADEDLANFKLMTEAARMYSLLVQVRTALVADREVLARYGMYPSDRFEALLDACERQLRTIEGASPCGANLDCVHESACIVTWEHTVHRGECGCRSAIIDTPQRTVC